MVGRISKVIWSAGIWKETHGQDMLEYALFVAAIATLYAAVSPSVATSLSTIFSKINSSMSGAASTG